MRKVSHTLKKILSNWLEILTGIILSGLVIFVLLSVTFRSVIKIGVPWTDDLVIMLFQYLVFLGAAVGVKYNAHFTVDLLGIFPNKLQKWLVSAGYAVTLIFILFFTYSSWQFTVQSIDTFGQGLPISMAFTYAVMPFSGILMIYYFIKQWISEIRHWKKEAVHK
ncbi:TRAP transporter small permease [Sporolactobacillus sp. THM7-4]|nr:TRAP transporter small permease [Sporolactobacillus sp. THM7-4]